MYTKLKKMNSGGFTLVEIIASIAILGMVIVVLLPIFPQIMNWTKMTDDELVSSNLLGQVAKDIKGITIATSKVCPATDKVTSDTLGEYANYTMSGKEYTVKAVVCQSNDEKSIDLIRTHIQIYSKGKFVTESYTYIPGEQ